MKMEIFALMPMTMYILIHTAMSIHMNTVISTDMRRTMITAIPTGSMPPARDRSVHRNVQAADTAMRIMHILRFQIKILLY